jgi:hypothetical protein
MKVFDEHFVERLLEGVKEKVKWTYENGVYFFSNYFFYSGINHLFLEKNRKSLSFFFFKISCFNFCPLTYVTPVIVPKFKKNL